MINPEKLLDLGGKTAIVTGGSRGIGAAIAETLAACGSNVVISSRQSSEEQAQEVVSKIKSYGVEGLWVAGDVAQMSTGKQIVKQTIERMGRLDILINNAGTVADDLFIKMNEEKWDRVLKTNLYGAAFVTQAALRELMRSRQGSIVSISSEVTHGNPGQANYAASKGGLEAFMRVIAVEYASKGIRANVISCGPVETALWTPVGEDQKQALLRLMPLNRVFTPHEIARVALFLASDMSSPITGQVINADGGMVR